MIITRVEASNFLSFEQFDLALRPGVNVIVGPNGAGKSNVLRIVSTVFSVLREAATDKLQQPGPRATASVWERLVPRIGSDHPDGWLVVAVRLDDDELQGLVRFVRAVAEVKVLEGLGKRQPGAPKPPADLADLLTSRFSAAAVEPLRAGRLVLSFTRSAVQEYQLAYEFDVEVEGSATTFHAVLTGSASASTIRKGRALDEHDDTPAAREAPITGLDLQESENRVLLGLSSLLPLEGATFWGLYRTNLEPHPLLDACLESLRPDLLSASYMWNVSLGTALSDALSPRITWVDGVHGPPQFDYEPWPGYGLEEANGSSTVPLRLYRLMVGSAEQRREYRRISETFNRLTELRLEIQALEALYEGPGRQELATVDSPDLQGTRLTWVKVPGQAKGFLRCEPRILLGDSDVRIDRAGAGAWEVLVNVTMSTPGGGGVALLDEPATNMFPQLQRDFLAHLEGIEDSQLLIVTHSPYLVPARTDDDLHRITRIHGGSGKPTRAHVFEPRATAEKAPRYRGDAGLPALSRLAARDDVRASLFAQGVIAVEGESEQLLLLHVLNDPTLVGVRSTLESRGYLVVDVQGQSRFGAYLDVLLGFQIPFVTFVDGPALRPGSSLDRDLRQRGIVLPTGRANESFRHRKERYQEGGIFTLANTFGGRSGIAPSCPGCKRAHGHPQPGEIESWLHRHFRSALHKAYAAKRASESSKTHVIRQVLENIELRKASPAVRELIGLYEAMGQMLERGGIAASASLGT